MSSRSSIYYGHGLHVFEEVMSEEICIECEHIYIDEKMKVVKSGTNEKYQAFTMPKEAWVKLAKNILKKLEGDDDYITLKEEHVVCFGTTHCRVCGKKMNDE